MTVRLSTAGAIELHGDCPLEDAQALHQYLLADPKSTVDWRACDSAHTAVVQVLLAARPVMLGPPRSDFLEAMVEPLLKHPD